MKRKILIFATTILCFFAFANKLNAVTVNFTTGNSYAEHQCWPIGNKVNPLNSTVPIQIGITDGSFHHYNAYLRNVNDLNTNIATLVTNATSGNTATYNWYANTAGTYRVCVVVYDAGGTELVNTKSNVNYNFEVKSISAGTGSATSVTANSAYLAGGSNVTGFGCQGVAYRVNGSSTWTYVTCTGGTTVSGLSQGTTYQYCGWADFITGMYYGEVWSFTTIPSQPGTINGTTPVCAGSSAQTYSISAVTGATSYTWTLPSGWSGSSTSTSISATPGSSAQSGTISVTANNSSGSSSARTFSVTVNTPPTAPTGITGTTTICSGSSTTLTASGGSTGSGCTYQWYSGGCGSGSVLGTGISLTVSPTSNTTYYVRRVGTSPCGSTTTSCASVTITVNVVPSQPGTISGTTPVCAGSSSQTYSISAVSGATSYTWTLPSGWSGSSTTTSISATPGASAQSGNISVTANSSCGSSTARTFSVTVNSIPAQPGNISGTTPVCAGSGTQTYSISAVSGATSYTWTLPSGWSGSSTGTSISATPGSSAQSGTISVTANNSCGNSSASTLSVTVNSVPAQPGTISGSTSVCAGSGAQTYSISAVSGATSYTWTIPSGWTGSSSGTSIIVTPNANAQSGYFSVTANSSCGSSPAITFMVTVNSAPAQPGTISGSTSVIMGSGALTYSISAVSGATSYTWTLPSGWTGSSTSTSISATPGSNAQNGYIRVMANNSCGNSSEQTLYVTTNPNTPSQPGEISGATSACAGSGAQTYSISAVLNATSYTWTLPSGWSGSSTTTSISATPSASAQSGTISVTANNSSGSSPARTLSITVNSAPTQPGTINGTTSVCAGSGTQTYSISAVSGATSYTWTLPSGWSGSSTTTSISATPGSSAQSGNISVTANNNCGSSSTRTLSVSVSTVPSQPGTISGSSSVGASSGVQTYSISAVSGATSYTWTLPSGWSGSSTSTSISATPEANAQSGNISVTANNSCGSSTARTLSVTINALPTITGTTPGSVCGNGTVTLGATASSGATVRWYSSSSGGSVLATGTSYTTPSISATTTYYAEAYNSSTSSVSSSRIAITATVNVLPTITGTTPGSRDGTGTVTLSASVNSGVTVRWYSSSSGGNVLATGTSFTTPSISTTTTYYAEAYNSSTTCVSSSRTSVVATVIPTTLPTITNTTPGSVCGSGTVTLGATTSSGATARWYSSSTGGSVLATGTSFTTPSISTTTTYFAEAYNSSTGSVSSSRTAVTATVNALPTITGTTPGSRSGTGTVSLSATTSSGATARWYSSSTGGSVLATGTSFTTPSISTTTTYFAEAYNSNSGCVSSSRTSVVATVNTSCSVEPLLTTYWQQVAPYNSQCPTVQNARSDCDGRALVGCVATAMGQIMNYWERPIQRTQSIPSYSLGTTTISTTNTATYEWSNMLDSYSGSYTATQKNAVAKLLYDCGVAVRMNYSAGSRGATTIPYDPNDRNSITAFSAFPTYFGYNNNILAKYRGTNDTEEWENLLRSELNDHRPVMYRGVSTEGGHAFVCDGYNCDGYFHFNWGWGEAYQGNSNNANNGYFISSLYVSGYDFKSSQGIIYNIKPNSDDYIVPTNPDGTNTFSVSANALTGGYIIPEGTTIRYAGENQPLAFAANSGYEIDQVYIDGTPDAAAKANGFYIFSDVTTNHSIIVTFKESVTGIEVIHSQKISIYPNPTKSELFIKTDLSIKKVEISDLSGRNVKVISVTSAQNGVQTISVSSLLKGIYLVKVYTDNGLTVSKIVKE